MKKALIIVAFGLLLTMVVSPIYAYEAMYGPSEMIHWDAEKAYNGYTLIGSYLLDMEGNVCHILPGGGFLMENGNIFGGRFQVRDWDGNTVWRYTETREDYHPHHDSNYIYNPKLKANTVMFIANKDLTHEQVISAGADPKDANKGKGGRYDGCQMDAIVEVDMNGNVVWEWWFFDHLVQDMYPSKNNYVGRGKTIADYPGKLDINWGYPVDRDWLHCNSVDFNPELDQMVVNSVHGEFFVVDHGATFVPGDPEKSIALAASDAGDFIYRFGDPAKYGQGEKPSISQKNWLEISTGTRQNGATHDVQWILPGYPGAGNFTIFNNNDQVYQSSVQSQIIEVNPYLDSNGKNTGHYVNPPDAGYNRPRADFKLTHQYDRDISKQIVWSWRPAGTSGFFSNHGSGCIRLPNGNTLISASSEGHVLEITLEGEVAWEYIYPITRGSGIKKIIGPEDFNIHAVSRSYRYAPDHPALKGRDLKPQGTITELAAQGKITAPKARQQRDKGKGDKGKKGGKK
jgi:hypothetical protein